MKAVQLHDYDAADGLRIDEIDRPPCAPDEILLRVHGASVNPVDWRVRDGTLRQYMPFALPIILGGDVAGVVERVGSSVVAFKPGDAVFAMTETTFGYAHGGFAEYASLKAGDAAHRPASLDHAAAAAVPLAGLTAWQALHDRGGVQAGQRVLIHAAAGGVGGFAVQFARAAGAYVIGTASSANLDHLRALGADEAIDYAAAPFETTVRDVDLVIDLVGGDVQARSIEVLRRGGTLVNALGALAEEEARAAGVTVTKVAVRPNGQQLREIAALIDAGTVQVSVAHRFPLNRVEDALSMSRRGHGRGKIVIDVASN